MTENKEIKLEILDEEQHLLAKKCLKTKNLHTNKERPKIHDQSNNLPKLNDELIGEKKRLSTYCKKKIMEHFHLYGSDAKHTNQVLTAYNLDKDYALEYFNKHLKRAQDNVQQQCDSLSFAHISEWLNIFEKWQLPGQCFYEQSIVINEIVNNELFPLPEDFYGVDLRSIYKFLGNALKGLPQVELSKESAAFLAEEFEMLINEANTPEADVECRKLKQKLDENLYAEQPKKKLKISLDPLGLKPEIDEYLL